MKDKRLRFRVIDGLLIAMMILPLVAAMVLNILTTPESEGISITGALVYFTIPMPLMDLPITESQVNTWLVMITILGACLFLTASVRARAARGRWLPNGLWRSWTAWWARTWILFSTFPIRPLWAPFWRCPPSPA